MPFSQGRSPQPRWRRSKAQGPGFTRLHVAGPMGFSPGLSLGASSPVVGEHAPFRATDSGSRALAIKRNEVLIDTATWMNL